MSGQSTKGHAPNCLHTGEIPRKRNALRCSLCSQGRGVGRASRHDVVKAFGSSDTVAEPSDATPVMRGWLLLHQFFDLGFDRFGIGAAGADFDQLNDSFAIDQNGMWDAGNTVVRLHATAFGCDDRRML